jgi:NAD(P)-dependent dehydrogenase (short-subunit alcohol dehydrogenase family)
MNEDEINDKKFAGGVAVITGAGAGIGAGLARRAGELGMTVVVTDLNTARAESVAQTIRDAGGSAEAMTVDVSIPSELDRLAEEVFSKHKSVRLLINNAGIETLGFSWEIPATRWETTLNINIHGVVHGLRAFLPKMLATKEECWVANLSSIGGFSQMPTQSAYILTKHAVQSFTECLSLEMDVKKAPIHVASITPGMLKTQIFESEAGAGETADGATYRKAMRELMANHGMDLDEGCRRIMSRIAANEFWVDTQPEMTKSVVDGRIAFLRNQQRPKLSEQAAALIKS